MENTAKRLDLGTPNLRSMLTISVGLYLHINRKLEFRFYARLALAVRKAVLFKILKESEV